MHSLGRNKKMADDTWVLQAAINLHATAPASIANEFTKPQLSMHVINKFCSYDWVATGNEILDGIMPFNNMFVTELAARAMAMKVECLRAVESGGMAMIYSDVEIFLKSDCHFPADSTACTYHLAAHSLLVDLMLCGNSLFAVTY